MARPNKVGRKPLQIDWEEFDKLCAIHCTLEEMAVFFGMSPDTIEKRVFETYGVKFTDHVKYKRGLGKVSLRRAQFQAGLKGSVPMLIWLGKQILDQKEPVLELRELKEVQRETEGLSPLQFVEILRTRADELEKELLN